MKLISVLMVVIGFKATPYHYYAISVVISGLPLNICFFPPNVFRKRVAQTYLFGPENTSQFKIKKAY
jgi:hypothetical protein